MGTIRTKMSFELYMNQVGKALDGQHSLIGMRELHSLLIDGIGPGVVQNQMVDVEATFRRGRLVSVSLKRPTSSPIEREQ